MELRPAVRAGDWGLLSENPELELEGETGWEEEEELENFTCLNVSTPPQKKELIKRIVRVRTDEG